MAMQTGVVKWFNSQKGFGFIQPDGGGRDVFVHIKQCKNLALQDGDKVRFEAEEGRNGKGPAVTHIEMD